MSEPLNVRLSHFEGPLDLLLTLISKNKVNIYDIPISEILDQYLAALDQIRGFDIDATGDFAVMASHLLYIKSKMLLPRHEEEDEEDPRAQLVSALLEYQAFKEISAYLEEREPFGREICVKGQEYLEIDPAYNYNHSVDDLISAALAIVDREQRRLPPPVKNFKNIVGREKVTIADQFPYILNRLLKEGECSLSALLLGTGVRSRAVAVFLAVLELCRDRRIILNITEFDEVVLSLGENVSPKDEEKIYEY